MTDGIDATVDGVLVYLYGKPLHFILETVMVHSYGNGDDKLPFRTKKEPNGVTTLTTDPRLVLLALRERLRAWGVESTDLTKVEQDEGKAQEILRELLDVHGHRIPKQSR